MSIISFDFPELDKKDREILFELDKNARQSSSRIAEKTGLNKNVVNYRIHKLMQSGIVEGFYTVIDSARLGFSSFRTYAKLQFVSGEKKKEIISWLVAHPRTWWVGEIEGEWDLVFLVWVKSTAELREFWFSFMEKFQPFIQEKEIMPYTKIHDFSYAFFDPEKTAERSIQEVGPSEPVELTETETKVLPFIAAHARRPTVEIAKATGLTPVQVKYALRQLKEKKVILGFRTKISFSRLGLTHYKANFDLKDRSPYPAMLAFAQSKSNVIYVDESIGFADFEMELVVQKHAEFQGLVDEFREKFAESIRDYHYFVFRTFDKINYSPMQ